MPVTSPSTLNSITSQANDIFAIGKAVISSGILLGAAGWGIKRIIAYLTEHHGNVTKNNQDRSGELAKKEDVLISTTAAERTQIFDMFKNMLTEQSKQTLAIQQNAASILEMTRFIATHSELLIKHTGFVSKVSKLLALDRKDMISDLQNNLENSFAKYVHELQEHPEIAKRILADRHNVISSVLETVTDALDTTDFDVDSVLTEQPQPAPQPPLPTV